MIIDSRRLSDRAVIEGTYCIIGAGAAGITVANELAPSGEDIVLLESGGRRTRRDTQELCKGEVLDTQRHGALDRYRNRRFGGTTNVWGGRCAPFDPIDFEARPHVPWSGWPITKSELDPYYARAHMYCDLGEYTYDAQEALPGTDWDRSLEGSCVESKFIWRFSLPTDFGRKFWGSFTAARNIRVYLHATALQLEVSAQGDAVAYVIAGSLRGNRFRVKAKRFIIATGGLEAARLLLVSRACNTHGNVGRFYISHITGDLGEVVFVPGAAASLSNYVRSNDGVYCRRAFSINEQKQREEGLLNLRAIVSHPSAVDPHHGSGVLSAMYLLKRFVAARIPPEYSKPLSDAGSIQHFGAHCGNVLKQWRQLSAFGGIWLRKRILSRRKLPSIVYRNPANRYTLHFDAEQAPNPESRVSLSNSKDRFGFSRLRVDWRCTSQDIDSVIRSAAWIGGELRKSGLGQFEFDPEQLSSYVAGHTGVGSHHIGTTRMADTASKGVVDRNCQVHGIDNLFIASSSVFPTSSFANPTLTIIALAIRLGSHLREVRSPRPPQQIRVNSVAHAVE